MFQSEDGMNVKEFLAKYGAEIRGKDILYVVQTNLAEDNVRTTINTRVTKAGVNVKIGKSEGFGEARLKAYTHMNSNLTRMMPT